jgi:hypothetical protein
VEGDSARTRHCTTRWLLRHQMRDSSMVWNHDRESEQAHGTLPAQLSMTQRCRSVVHHVYREAVR